MALATPTKSAPKPLRLSLRPNDVLPAGLTWLIHDGYLRTTTWDEEGEAITLGIWGPGELVSNAHSGLDPVEVQCLSTVVVEQHNPNDKDMNLTHRALGEVSGLTRGTVTKNLNRYKTIGLLQSVSEADLLIPSQFLAAAC
jgi:CRP-like cAMP-binding protein